MFFVCFLVVLLFLLILVVQRNLDIINVRADQYIVLVFYGMEFGWIRDSVRRPAFAESSRSAAPPAAASEAAPATGVAGVPG